MFGKSKTNNLSEWSVNMDILTNTRTFKTYRLANTHSCFNEEKEQISIWYLGKYLATIPCTKKQHYKTFSYYHTCDHFIHTDFKFEALDSSNRLWTLKEDSLESPDQESLCLVGLRFVEGVGGITIYLYGKKQVVFPETDINILEQIKDSILDKRYKRLDKEQLKQLEDNPYDRDKNQLKEPSIGTLNKVMITTETALDVSIEKRLDIVTAEIAFGMNVFKDISAAFSDFFGGRNQSIQNTLREAKETVLLELKREALRVGGDAVIAVDLDYSEISGGGKSMLFLVASGTAVKLKK